LTKVLFFIAKLEDLDNIKVDKIDFAESKIISCDISSHKGLEQRGIVHEILDNFLTEDEREKLFDVAVSFHSWYKDKLVSKELEFEGINLLAFMDTIEFHSFIMPELINFYAIKKIIKKENPSKIISSSNFARIINSLLTGKDIEVFIFKKNDETELYWDKFTIRYNIGKFPISFKISRNTYLKIKNFVEWVVCSTNNLWFNFKNSKKRTILLLEFYPPLYQKLLSELKKFDLNILVINRRRPAISDFKSIKVLQKTNSKMINFNNLLTKKEKAKINILSQSYHSKLEKLWSNEDLFNNLFKIDDSSFWNVIRDRLMLIYERRLNEYLILAISIKKIFEKVNIRCILSLYEVGETEKAFLEVSNKRVKSILLEHGFSIFFPQYSRYDILSSYSNFNDKIAVWSNLQKKYLVEHRKINPSKILVTGSPRHDSFFEKKFVKKSSKRKTVLIAPTPITELQGHDEILAHVRFEHTLKKVCSILQKNPEVEIIVKTHPSQSEHNNEIISTISKIDSTIPIYLFNPVIELLKTCDVVITITPEGFAPSTIILESLICNKPTMNIVLDDHIYDFDYVKNKAVLSLSYKESLEENISNMLFNDEFRNKMINNGKEFVKGFLINQGSASVELANILHSY
jgi:hypothetical protein